MPFGIDVRQADTGGVSAQSRRGDGELSAKFPAGRASRDVLIERRLLSGVEYAVSFSGKHWLDVAAVHESELFQRLTTNGNAPGTDKDWILISVGAVVMSGSVFNRLS